MVLTAAEIQRISSAMTLLSEKSDADLSVLCKNLGRDNLSSRDEMVDFLVSPPREEEKKSSLIIPQAIPLRSNIDGELLKGAVDTFKKWRRQLFTSSSEKTFSLIDNEGKSYEMRMKCLSCPPGVFLHCINSKWVHPQAGQEPLIQAMRDKPGDFIVHVVQKKTGSNTYIMLHAKGR